MSKRVYAKWYEVILQFGKGSTDARMGSRSSGRFMSGDGDYLPKGNCFIEGDKLYSYGSHYTLAMRLDPEQNAGVKFLINGDQSSVTTNAQRNHCIRALKDNIQVPFSALESAGVINRWTARFAADFRVLHNQPDEWVHRTDTQGRKLYKLVQLGETKILTEGVDDVSCADPIKDHYLGTVLLFADNRRYLSGLDLNEPGQRHYFLTRLPESSQATTVQQAYEDLKPAEVREAIMQGLVVLRQGDVFFIPTAMTTKYLTTKSKGSVSILDASHYPSQAGIHMVEAGAHTYARGFVTHKPDHSGPHHRRLKLGDGKQWYRAVRNTADGSWEAMGNVD